MKNDLTSILSKALAYVTTTILTIPMGAWMLIAIVAHQIVSFLQLAANLKVVSQADSATIDAVTKDRLWIVYLVALLATTAIAPLATLPQVAIPLALVSLIGLGFVGLRGIEHAASNSNEFTLKHKLVGNLAAGALAALIAACVNPAVHPHVLAASAFTGWALAFFSTLKQIPRILAMTIAVAIGCTLAYNHGGALSVVTVLVGAVYQVHNISESLKDVQKRVQDEYAIRSGQATYTLGFTLLLTSMAAAVLTGIAQLLH